MHNPAKPEPKQTFEDKALQYISHNYGKCWLFVAVVCAAGVMWRNSWV